MESKKRVRQKMKLWRFHRSELPAAGPALFWSMGSLLFHLPLELAWALGPEDAATLPSQLSSYIHSSLCFYWSHWVCSLDLGSVNGALRFWTLAASLDCWLTRHTLGLPVWVLDSVQGLSWLSFRFWVPRPRECYRKGMKSDVIPHPLSGLLSWRNNWDMLRWQTIPNESSYGMLERNECFIN